MPKYLMTLQIETDQNMQIPDPNKYQREIQELLTKRLVEACVLDTDEVQVTHVYDLQQAPED